MHFPDNSTEAQALDTQADGVFDTGDSPFSPYYPGDEFVDWVGLSVYYKGPNHQNVNVPQNAGYCYGAINNYNPDTGVATADSWYPNYCAAKNKACMVSCNFSNKIKTSFQCAVDRYELLAEKISYSASLLFHVY